MAADFDYDVFISYSRDTVDHDIAVRLQNELQRFTTPWYRPGSRTLRVFRDQTNLQASPDLWGTIEDAMSSSRWLLLVASPRSAESAGVRHELTWWREHRGTANICIALIDGELRWDQAANDFKWPASTALFQGALGQAFETEPAWIDLRPVMLADGAGRRRRIPWLTRSLADPRLQDATASLIAEVKQVPKDTLIGEHLRRSRQTRRAVTSALSTLTILLVAAIVAASLAVGQAHRATHQATVSEAGQLAAISETLTSSHLDLAELFAAEAYHLYPDPQTRAALFGAVTADPRLVRYLPATGSISAVATSADGQTAVAGTSSGTVLSWNLTDFQRSLVGSLPAAVSSVAASANGNTIAATDGSAALVWVRGKGIRRVPVPARWTTVAAGVSPSGRYAVFSLGNPAGVPWLLLIDEQTGRSVMAPADVNYPAVSLSFDGQSQLVILAYYGSWERLAVPSLTKVLASNADFGLHDHAQAMSATGRYISFTNGGPPLNVYNTVTTPTPHTPALGAWEVGDTPSALAISGDGRVAADADSGTIYASGISRYKDASSSTLLSLPGNTTINPNTLTFVGRSDSELLSASGSLVTLWNLSQYSRMSSAAPADIPQACAACAGPGIYPSPGAGQAVITSGFSKAAMLINLPPTARSITPLPQNGAGSPEYGPALWSHDGRGFSILTPSNGSGQIWSTTGKLGFVRDWATSSAMSKLPDTGFDAPVSLISAAGGKEIIELDTVGNIIIRNSSTGAVERQVAGPVGPGAANPNSQYLAAAGPGAKYAAVIVPISGKVDVINIGTGAITRLPGGPATGLAYDGEQLLIQRSSGTFEVRSADGQQLIRSFAGDLNATAGPAANGTGLAVEVNSNGTALVFDIASGQEIGSITLPAGPRNVSTSVVFTPDGRNLISATEGAGGSSGTGYVTDWNFSPSRWSTIACTSAGHTLTSAEWQEYVGTGGPGMPSQLAC
ncbi:MAG TPA: toll/interleukin-1 receptor domain-containing protein [Streptosporangiaceae bacterium]|nr:toll/interleukin-1 receptor domain-containing protein [Streptosporangiaceae bacterium]